jgi:cell division protein FtsW (lipid II flippase)
MQKVAGGIKEESHVKFSGQATPATEYQTMETGWSNGDLRSKLIGVPAVLILGIGLMIVGKIWLGLVVMGVAIFFVLIALSEVGWKAFWFAVAALIFGCVFGFQALSGTIRGQTTYTNFQKRRPMEVVTRDESPEKFRAAIKARWAFAAFGWFGAAGGFAFYRTLRKTEW